jgi:hypothetical protein
MREGGRVNIERVRSRRARSTRSRRAALLAFASILIAGCTAGTTLIGGYAAPVGMTPATSTPSLPPVTVTVVKTVAAPVPSVYRKAAPPVAAPGRRTGLPWWGTPVDLNNSSSLTFSGAYDDSANIYIQPTVPVRVANSANIADSGKGNTWSAVGLTASTNGQLVAIAGNHGFTCSATVVHSPKHNLVVTAAHCAWIIPVGRSHAQGGDEMRKYDEIWFIPGASQLVRPLTLNSDGEPEVDSPYGMWRVEAAATNEKWLQNTWVTESGSGTDQTEIPHGDGSYDDIAFLTIESANGHDIEDVTGAQGLMFSDTSRKADQVPYPTVILGYPAAPPFDGSEQKYCSSRTPVTFPGDQSVSTASVSCEMTPGSSGGAWFTGFDKVGGGGYVYGVTSRGGTGYIRAGILSLAADYPLYRRLTGT